MSLFDVLLAKNWAAKDGPPDRVTLVGHLLKCVEVGEAIVQASGNGILENLGLNSELWRKRLSIGLHWACLTHDIGKANSAFQSMVRGKSQGERQAIRHEFISALLLLPGAPLHRWILEGLDAPDGRDPLFRCVIGAVTSHHVKLGQDFSLAAPFLREGGCGTEMRILVDHSDLKALPGFPAIEQIVFSLLKGRDGYPVKRFLQFSCENGDWQGFLEENPDWRSFAGALKGILMGADALASALPAPGVEAAAWARESLSTVLSLQDLEKVVSERLQGREVRPFQAAIGASDARVTVVQAGCGSGKTLGAYLWGQQHSVGKKMFFCYPTTGTATEGYLGYVAHGQAESELIHSRADVDLEDVYQAESGSEAEAEGRAQIESLRMWDPAVVICTADTVLSLARNGRRGLYGSPALLNAVFVFDEVHSYDARMFEAMIAFMKALSGAHFLLMSASLSTERISLLQRDFPECFLVPSPEDLEAIQRYELRESGREEALRIAGKTLRRGGKVLWVANTVGRAQRLAHEIDGLDYPVVVYHSRFRYKDRVDRHREVIQSFEGEGPVLAVTTQVAEMSLDLDADLLVTELAPVPALIQRLGRLNRRVTPDRPGLPRKALFIEPQNAAPYSPEELKTAKEWLNRLAVYSRPVSQRDLLDAFRSRDEGIKPMEKGGIEWLDSGWYAEPSPVRELGGSVPVLLEEDFDVCRNLTSRDMKRELIRRAIPVNLDERVRSWRVWKHHFIAPAGSVHYSAKGGLEWPKN